MRLPLLLLAMTTIGITGCSQPAALTESPSLEALDGSRWLLRSWSGHSDSERLRSIELQFEGSRLGGEGPCNIYNAEFKLDSGGISVGAIAATKRGCEPEISQLERDWFDALGKLQRLELKDGSLVLEGSDGLRLAFERDARTPDET